MKRKKDMKETHKENCGKEDDGEFGMTGEQVFRALNLSLSLSQDNAPLHMEFAHCQLLYIHARALSAHCECLGMNAENMWAAIANANPVYKSEHYFEIMQKWGLVNEKGESTV